MNMDNWTKENIVDSRFGADNPPLWPNEFLVKLLSSSAYSEIKSNLPIRPRVLEVGIFAGNNARMLKEKNFEVFGSEINSEMVAVSEHYLKALDLSEVEVRQGSNEMLDFPDNYFDVLVSINTLHYSSGKGTDRALAEFARVLKPGGFAIVETPSEEHFIPKKCQRINECEWIWKAGGFRDGEVVGFFDSKEHLMEKFKNFFKTVDVMSRSESYSSINLAWWIAVAKK
jgi:ubiquinone/menaquinone biosynthesis C-methylase UbiE